MSFTRDLNVKNYIGLAADKPTELGPGDTFRETDTGDFYIADANGELKKVTVESNTFAGSKVFRAIINQTGTNAPTVQIIENTLGGTIVWTRDGAGAYFGTLSGAFTTDKTLVFIGSATTDGADLLQAYWSSTDDIWINTFDPLNVPSDDLLLNVALEIRVFN